MPAENMILLETIALTQSAASVTFDNLPTSGYTDLKIVLSVRNTTATTVGNVTLDMQINGLTTGYTGKQLYGSGTSVGSLNRNNVIIGTLNSANDTANTFSNIEVYIPNYRSSNAKSYSVDSVSEGNTTVTELDLLAKLNSTTSPITSITFLCSFDSFAANSTFSLYGIAAYGTTPVVAPKAEGGNIVANDGTYWYHAFTSSGYFVPQVGLSCDVLVVAGGGGGGFERGGGGGAGGLLAFTSQALANGTNYACTVGSGGSGMVGYNSGGSSGNDSQFGALTLVKGGGKGGSGGAGAGVDGVAGGSSGGSGYYSQVSTSPSVSGQGTAGGASSTSGAAGGGGGGASVAGSKAVAPAGGAGGAGSSTYSSWGLATSTGQNSGGTYYYAGGGAGGNDNSGTTSGGLGGGGSTTASGSTAGTANTGGGGGAGSFGLSIYAGAAGGSGIIIVRYPIN